MPSFEIPTEIVDTQTGAVVEHRTATMHVMPPDDPLACQTCGRRHDPGQPHDATHLHYQYSFYAEHGRWPTWKDALAHCDEHTRAAWEDELRRLGQWPVD